jgi:hypothetical protein
LTLILLILCLAIYSVASPGGVTEGVEEGFGSPLAYPSGLSAFFSFFLYAVLILLAVTIFLYGCKRGHALYRLRRYLRSAELELMEKYGRWRKSDGGDGRIEKSASLFERLVEPTIRINDRQVKSAIVADVAPPVHIFQDQTTKILDKRESETDKASSRKNAVRLNASLLRLVLLGAQEVAAEKLRSLSAAERSQVTASLVILIREEDLSTPVNLTMAMKLWEFPTKLYFETGSATLTGCAALDAMATL